MISNSNIIDLKSRSTLNTKIYSSIDNPDVEFFLKSVGYFLNSLLISSVEEVESNALSENSNDLSNNLNSFFTDNNESNSDLSKLPTFEDVHTFTVNTYNQLNMDTEMLICAVIYIIRASENNVKLMPINWRSILFIALVLAKKVCDYASIPDMHYKLLSEISGNILSENEVKIREEKFLFGINYHTAVKHSIYLRFFMELKNLLRDEYFEQAAKIKPMSLQDFEKIKEETLNYEENIKKKLKTS